MTVEHVTPVFVAASAVMVGNEIWRNPATSLAGLAIIGAGVPIYVWMRRRYPR